MSATIVGTTKAGSASNVGSLPVTTPAGTQVGDLIVMAFELKATPYIRAVGPDGTWTTTGNNFQSGVEFNNYANTSVGAVSVARKVATSAGAQSFTFSFVGTSVDVNAAASAVPAALCVVVRGQATSNPLAELAFNNGITQPVTFPSVTPAQDAEMILRFCGGSVASGSTNEKVPTWDGAVTPLDSAQGINGTGTGLAWIVGASEVGPTPAAATSTRSLTLQSAPASWARVSLGVVAAPSGAPTNTVAPAVTGTAAVGSVLAADNGSWDQTGLAYAHQWQRDGSNISGATASTYTVVSGDAGHTIRDVVTATGSGGATSANSNGIAIPSAPVNTVAPVVSRVGGGSTYATGDQVTTTTGTWAGTGIAYAYQWYRGTSPISGETGSTYTLALTDEGANISARVTATNGGGATTADSNVIVPAVTAPISDASFLSYLSGGTGNSDPSASYGGARGGTVGSTVNNLFGPILGTVAQAGGTFYRVIYVRNTHTTATAASCQLFLEQQYDPTSGLTLSVAVPSQAVNTTVPALASGTTAPSGVTWTSATTSGGGRAFGNLGPGDYRGVYVRLVVAPGATPTSEADAIIAVEGSAA